MSYEEEDTCHCQRHGISTIIRPLGNEVRFLDNLA
jgi:hypothetical protein